ncbi:jg14485 [Pararge aegeria aegeria]|uniref:Jg14485 protein n=1 Tax=Pararge aegeria aegeria TaxID=348720 RepID=A0A8S4S0G8_9NEOP|nr:jg14485 [Pararge aegeria aegeria]
MLCPGISIACWFVVFVRCPCVTVSEVVAGARGDFAKSDGPRCHHVRPPPRRAGGGDWKISRGSGRPVQRWGFFVEVIARPVICVSEHAACDCADENLHGRRPGVSMDDVISDVPWSLYNQA